MLKEHRSAIQFTARQPETLSIKRLERILKAENSHPRLVSSTGEEILLPESVYVVLRQVVDSMASGQSITIVSHDHEMTTQEAADLLNVSRPYLIKLLDQDKIPYVKVGSHRRVRSQDVIAYKKQRDVQRRKGLSEITTFLQEEGFYNEDSLNSNL